MADKALVVYVLQNKEKLPLKPVREAYIPRKGDEVRFESEREGIVYTVEKVVWEYYAKAPREIHVYLTLE